MSPTLRPRLLPVSVARSRAYRGRPRSPRPEHEELPGPQAEGSRPREQYRGGLPEAFDDQRAGHDGELREVVRSHAARGELYGKMSDQRLERTLGSPMAV